MATTILTVRYLKPAQFDSSLFAVVEHNQKNKNLHKKMRTHEGANYLYVKDRLLPQMEEKTYYKMKLHFDTFTNGEGTDITFIDGCRLKETNYQPHPVVVLSDFDSDSDVEMTEN